MPSVTTSIRSEAPAQSRKSAPIDLGDKANGALSAKSHTNTKPANGRRRSNKGTRSRRLRRKTRSWIYIALLPFFYLAFVLLHCVFWLASSIPRKIASIRRRRQIPPWADQVERKLWEQGRSEGCKDSKIRVPRHLALLIPSTPPSSSLLILHLIGRFFRSLLAPSQSPHRTSIDTWQEHQLADTVDRFKCLQAILRHAALAGVPVVSFWDSDAEAANSLWNLIASDSRFVRKNHTWSLRMDNLPSTSASPSPATLRVDVWDGQRRRECNDLPGTKGNGIERDDPILTIRLNILSWKYEGRDAFASVSRSIAADFLRKQTIQNDGDRESIKTSGSVSLKDSVDKLSVSDVDRALVDINYPISEPDFLLSISSSPPSRSIADYPRWSIRLTEICHTSVTPKSYTVVDFWGALMQFTRAEHRYGR